MRLNKLKVVSILGASLLLVSCSESHPDIERFEITVLDSTNGVVKANKETAIENELVSLSIESNYGYVLDSIAVNDKLIQGTSFKMPAADVTIKVTFELGVYDLTIAESPYGVISASKESATYGDSISLECQTFGNYVLDHYEINGETIDGNRFRMPGEDSIVEGVFKKAIDEYEASFVVYGGGVGASSFWKFAYDDNGINIGVQVRDRYICNRDYISDPGYRDNIEFILSNKSDEQGWRIDNSTKVLISCDGDYFIQKASTGTSWGFTMSPSKEDFTFSAELKSKEEGGYDGYDVHAFISYEFMNTDKEKGLGNLTISMAQRNSMFYNATNWDFYREDNCLWESAKTHHIIDENGNLIAR